MLYEQFRVTVPEGQSNEWPVSRFTVSDADAKLERLRAAFVGGRGVPAGTYTRLKRGRTLVMSDTPDEISDHLEAIHRAKGHVLINGLGLGMVLQAVARKPQVSRVTVVEVSPDVIALVWPHYKAMFGDKIEVVHADALTYKPTKDARYDVVWHDIWDYICSDNLLEMKTLHRRYGRLTEWQGSWARYLCERGR